MGEVGCVVYFGDLEYCCYSELHYQLGWVRAYTEVVETRGSWVLCRYFAPDHHYWEHRRLWVLSTEEILVVSTDNGLAYSSACDFMLAFLPWAII